MQQQTVNEHVITNSIRDVIMYGIGTFLTVLIGSFIPIFGKFVAVIFIVIAIFQVLSLLSLVVSTVGVFLLDPRRAAGTLPAVIARVVSDAIFFYYVYVLLVAFIFKG